MKKTKRVIAAVLATSIAAALTGCNPPENESSPGVVSDTSSDVSTTESTEEISTVESTVESTMESTSDDAQPSPGEPTTSGEEPSSSQPSSGSQTPSSGSQTPSSSQPTTPTKPTTPTTPTQPSSSGNSSTPKDGDTKVENGKPYMYIDGFGWVEDTRGQSTGQHLDASGTNPFDSPIVGNM